MEQEIDNVQKTRKSNFELLRIFAMFIIILHHYCVHGGGFNNLNSDNITFNLILTKVMSFGKYANHIFIILTGYFMIKSKVNYKKIITLILEMFFYSIIISIVFYGFNLVEFNKDLFIKSLAPIFWGNWFLVNYIILYLLIPFINEIIEQLDKRQLKNIILILVLVTIVVPTFSKNAWRFSEHDILIIDYLIGAFIRLYYSNLEMNKKAKIKIFAGLICVVIVPIVLMILLGIIFERNKLIQDCAYFVYNNYSIVTLILAIYTFLLFKDMKIKNNKYINYVSSSILGVYLIHDNEITRMWFWTKLWPNSLFINSNFYIIHMILKVIFVFGICLVIDKIRIFFFRRIEKDVSEYIYNYAKKIYTNVKLKIKRQCL